MDDLFLDMRSGGFEPSDFGTDGLTSDIVQAYHAHLGASYYTSVAFLIDSQQEKQDPHIVNHNRDHPTACDCKSFIYRGKCGAHFLRAQLVLDRRKARLAQEICEARQQTQVPLSTKVYGRDEAPLSSNSEFSFLKKTH